MQLSRAPHREGSVPGLMLCSCCPEILIILSQPRERFHGTAAHVPEPGISAESASRLLPRKASGHLFLLPFYLGSCLPPASAHHPDYAISLHPGRDRSSGKRGLGSLYLDSMIFWGKGMAPVAIPTLGGVT